MLDIEPFKTLLLNICGFTFINDRGQTLRESIARRMAAKNIVLLSDYYNLLTNDRSEMNMLIELLTVNETYFFREPEQLKLMIDRLIPELMSKKGRIKIISAGCSTGEEPYSIAISLYERYGEESRNLFSIIGVDIDAAAVSSAIKGVYSRYSFRALDNYMLKKYFHSFNADSLKDEPNDISQNDISPTSYSDLFSINEFIKKQASFQTANLNADNYPIIMWNPDIIFYRNVSIYFTDKIQQAIFSRLANLLNDEGYLVVSSTETLHHNTGILSLLEMDKLFVYKKQAVNSLEQRNQKKLQIPQPTQPTTLSSKSTSTRTIITQTKNIKTSTEFLQGAASKTSTEFPQGAASKTPPTSILSSLTIARDLIDEQNFTEAESICLDIIKQDELSLSAYLMLGFIACQKEENNEGLKRFREALYLDPTCWIAHFYLAETSNILGDKKRALIGYQSALDIIIEKEAAIKSNKQHEETKYFPLELNIENFKVVCLHKLNILRKAV